MRRLVTAFMLYSVFWVASGSEVWAAGFNTNVGSAANSWINPIVQLSDESLIVGGDFTTWNGDTVNRIVKLSSSGVLDSAFKASTGSAANATIRSIAVQADGKIVLGGDFTAWNGVSSNRVIRLNSDGTTDTSFMTNIGSGANNMVQSVFSQSDGKILVGGRFTQWNGSTRNRIVRLNADGTTDATFAANVGTAANDIVWSVYQQSGGTVLVTGRFSSWNGSAAGMIVQLDSNGNRISSFTSNTGSGVGFRDIYFATPQSDGKIVVGGYFTTYSSTTVNGVLRLNSDGSLDSAFTTNAGVATGGVGDVQTGKIQSDGKILLGGYFTTWLGATVNYVVRLNGDGTQDTSFSSNTGSGANGGVLGSLIQTDGKILLGGLFTSFNGQSSNYLIRLNANGSIDNGTSVSVSPAAVPTLSEWSQMLLGLIMMATLGWYFHKRQEL